MDFPDLAASASGREFLCSKEAGQKVIATYINVLTEAPPAKCAVLKK